MGYFFGGRDNLYRRLYRSWHDPLHTCCRQSRRVSQTRGRAARQRAWETRFAQHARAAQHPNPRARLLPRVFAPRRLCRQRSHRRLCCRQSRRVSQTRGRGRRRRTCTDSTFPHVKKKNISRKNIKKSSPFCPKKSKITHLNQLFFNDLIPKKQPKSAFCPVQNLSKCPCTFANRPFIFAHNLILLIYES